jgi:hypothetical protein
MAAACMASAVTTGCEDETETTGPTPHASTLAGRIDALDETKVSWDGLRITIFCLEMLTEMGEVVYAEGDEYRVQPVAGDHRFSFDLPAELEEGWIGEQFFKQRSCSFALAAYNDANGNGKFDYLAGIAPGSYDPYHLLAEPGAPPMGLMFVADPVFFERTKQIHVEYGWNYSSRQDEWRTDFDREIVLRSPSAAAY